MHAGLALAPMLHCHPITYLDDYLSEVPFSGNSCAAHFCIKWALKPLRQEKGNFLASVQEISRQHQACVRYINMIMCCHVRHTMHDHVCVYCQTSFYKYIYCPIKVSENIQRQTHTHTISHKTDLVAWMLLHSRFNIQIGESLRGESALLEKRLKQ